MILPKNPAFSQVARAIPLHIGWVLLSGIVGAFAQDVPQRTGAAEFQYIETLVFARPAGLAGANTAAAQGIDAVGYNPAGIAAGAPGRSVAGTFRYQFMDIASGNASYAYPGRDGVWSYVFSAAFINYGHIEAVDENGDPMGGKLLPASFNPSFSAARRLSEHVLAGATLRGFSEYLGDFEESQLGWGWGVDAGMQYQPSAKNAGFGLALLNLGRKERSQLVGGKSGGLLPVSLKAGFFYSSPEMPKARLVADAEAPWAGTPRLAGGLEYAYAPAFILRLGSRIDWNEAVHYYHVLSDEASGNWQGGNAVKLTAGFTFASDGYAVDYAAQYWQDLSWVHALTLRYSLL